MLAFATLAAPLDVSAKLVHTRAVEQLTVRRAVGGNIMCWLSVDHADEILQAETGQRLGIRKVHGSNWVVRESDLEKQRPTPVCLLDRTTVLFRFPAILATTARRALTLNRPWYSISPRVFLGKGGSCVQ